MNRSFLPSFLPSFLTQARDARPIKDTKENKTNLLALRFFSALLFLTGEIPSSLTIKKKMKIETTFGTLEVTLKSLAAFNLSQGGTIKNAPSFNEEINKQRGLPDANSRHLLRKIYSETFGIFGGNLTMQDIKKHSK